VRGLENRFKGRRYSFLKGGCKKILPSHFNYALINISFSYRKNIFRALGGNRIVKRFAQTLAFSFLKILAIIINF
jgi:hypothetical protein